MGEPISVVIGRMVSPSSFWVYPLPSLAAQECIDKVLQLEAELKESMEQGAGEQVTTNTPRNTLVAVAVTKQGCRSWHRGKLESVTQFQRKTHANVFLIDYGQVIEVRKVEGSVMVLPPCFSASTLAPLSFRIVLAGLQPASMDYDLELRGGMAVRPARTWDAAATRGVENMLARTSDKMAWVRNLVKDKIGRYHGQLDLLMANGKRIELNQWLVEMQFAIHSEAKQREDIDAEADEEEQAEESDEESFDSSLDSEVENDLEITRNMASVALKPPTDQPSASEDMLARSDMNKDEQTKTEERRARVKEMMLKLQAKKKAAEEPAKPVEESENMWDAFRKSGNSEIDKLSRASSNLLPGGVLLGKFHENVLFNLHADGIEDQRKKFERFVKKPCL